MVTRNPFGMEQKGIKKALPVLSFSALIIAFVSSCGLKYSIALGQYDKESYMRTNFWTISRDSVYAYPILDSANINIKVCLTLFHAMLHVDTTLHSQNLFDEIHTMAYNSSANKQGCIFRKNGIEMIVDSVKDFVSFSNYYDGKKEGREITFWLSTCKLRKICSYHHGIIRGWVYYYNKQNGAYTRNSFYRRNGRILMSGLIDGEF